jgi:uncharacterized flavoprotein (TIGR03862 family)
MSTALVIGGGPAGLMAADALLRAGIATTLIEAKPSLGRKFLMAGKSGLNLSRMQPLGEFLGYYGADAARLSPMIHGFGPQQARDWAEGLGQDMFTGSTGRLFPTVMKASPLLRAWMARLGDMGLTHHTRWRWTGWEGNAHRFDTPDGVQSLSATVTIFALGGGSWARLGSDGAWRAALEARGITTTDFAPSNAGLLVDWSPHMEPHFGTPLKGVAWHCGAQHSRGEAVISARGLEGGGIYMLSPALRDGHALTLDLAPDKSVEALQNKLDAKPDKLRLAHWLKKELRLPPAKAALFFEMCGGAGLPRAKWVNTLKSLPIRHAGRRPLDEAISTTGGLPWDALVSDLMLKQAPGHFCAGEMIGWDAPTGGYLLTACLATGLWAGEKAAAYCQRKSS